MIPMPEVWSMKPEAVAYRNMNRRYVDELFKKKETPIRTPNGKMRMPSNYEKSEFDREARNLWRTIIIESNKL